MKVLITGGGTGGHIYPAIAIANKIKSSMKDSDILFVGTKKGLESDLVPKAGYELKTITVSGFQRKLSIDTVKSVKDLFKGLQEAATVIKNFKPDIVIGTGGYVCGPVVFVASLMNIKTVIHEQNVIPGVTNKILSKFVNKILISFEESSTYFANSSKLVITGNPVRKEFIHFDRDVFRNELGIKNDEIVVTSFGGSRGAEKINEVMLQVMKRFSDRKEIVFYHITGERHYDQMMAQFKDANLSHGINLKILPYVHDMPKLMGASDLIISRSGAITLAEITAMGLPSILIPSPHVTNNHQEYNARVLEKNGAAVLLLEKDLNDKNIVDLLHLFIRDPQRLTKMSGRSKALSKANATDLIYADILKLINE
ncbi:MAG: undecaprenyldiphospho-muramoylpentapeptide beta-N-acetylglucosaminyltransferase [Anaerosolibacter sp.]|jgi:UDP-N-acetylglucosamine--N-acetylmuramyl-(pentapeptide) pyrophosphoryl-undecaprenol N-acetylglucosamine transferase|uniref:undecaprenyldiphospho-muramoylpentapeptide beta-N-acetylglucosaminyltransferase n=1 Tax=Anaerosolibacter sp. TaxID=1872527 RepID=UPI00261D281B|nr:undecaprenyldiphospho-muramoylpentapeptide beta-N-acetylglucosaminyltransferase [Anaerosolibacter sp.]MDF2546892.1 undecaprenyldiphospho-muramoylpentapeptide beta-N-acetylglucosaminyltransferase [Anaerosolibacter sp.]